MEPIAFLRGERTKDTFIYVEPDPLKALRGDFIGNDVEGQLAILKNARPDLFDRIEAGDETAFAELTTTNVETGVVEFDSEEVILRVGSTLKRIGTRKLTEVPATNFEGLPVTDEPDSLVLSET